MITYLSAWFESTREKATRAFKMKIFGGLSFKKIRRITHLHIRDRKIEIATTTDTPFKFPWLKFLDFAKFHVSQDWGGQISKIQVNFLTWLKFLDLDKFHVLQDPGGQKSQIWAKFSTWLKFSDFAKLHVLQDWGGQKFQIWVQFWTWLNFFISPNFMFGRTEVVKNIKFKQNFQSDSDIIFRRTEADKSLKFESNF